MSENSSQKETFSFLEISPEAGPLDLGLHQDSDKRDVSKGNRRKRRDGGNKGTPNKPNISRTEFSTDRTSRLK